MGYVLLQLVIFLVENFIRAVHLENGAIVTITILAGLCVIAEGLLIRRMAMKVSTPCIEKTKRGMQAIVYRSRNVWVLPIFFVIPGEAISAMFPYWPQFTIGHNSFALVLFPLVIGFTKLTRKELPALMYPKLADLSFTRAAYFNRRIGCIF